MKVKKVIVILIVLIFILNISKCYASTENLDISAESAILIDNSSERVLYSKNENEKMYPASTTKILTAILTLENCKLDDVFSNNTIIDYVSKKFVFGCLINNNKRDVL